MSLFALVSFLNPARAQAPNNIYGAHTFLQDQMSPALISKHLDWVRTLTGPGGYVKQLIYPIYPGTAASDSWKQFVQACYDRDLIPVLRLATYGDGGNWAKPPADSPGVYTTMANTIKNIVAALPKDDQYPMYIEVLNETNNSGEWSGSPNPIEYGQFLVQVAAALRSLGDARIKITNGGLSPGGSYNNIAYIEQMCANVPGFTDSFDAWATHPYTGLPPEQNFHDGSAPAGSYPIDSYVPELEVLARYGRTNVKIIATEGGYHGTNEDLRADLMMRAFRDYYSKWPEVLAICPWEFSNPFAFVEGEDWVYNDSTGAYPSHTHKIYDSVYQIAKVWMTTGTVSGKVTESQFGAPLAGATVTLSPGGATRTTDTRGNFMFSSLAPGVYSVTASKTNYTTASVPIISLSAAENEVANMTVTATVAAAIQGTLRDSLSNQPVAGVMVVANPGSFTAVTDSEGRYLFAGLSPTTYTLAGAKAGYYTFTRDPVAVGAGETHTLDWWMGPGGAPSGANLVSGFDFESPQGGGPAGGWIPKDGGSHPEVFSVDDTVRYSGNSSQRIGPNNSGTNQLWQMTGYHTVLPGRTYRIEVWVKTSLFTGNVNIKGNFYSDDTIYGGSFTCTPQFTGGSYGWTRFVGSGVAPTLSTPGGRLQVELNATVNTGAVWMDRVWAGEDTSGAALTGSPMSFSATPNPATARIGLGWYHGLSAGVTGTAILYRTDRYPLSISDGTLLVDEPGSLGASDSAQHTGASWGVRYYYAAFSHKTGGADPSPPAFATAVLQDSSPPGAPVSPDDGGAYIASADTLSASWQPAGDPQSGVVEYAVRVGASAGAGDVLDWTSVGPATQFARSGLALANGGTYFVTVRARNGAGLWGPEASTDGIVAAQVVQSAGAAKMLLDGTAVRLSGAVATSGQSDFPDRFYASQADRSSGIQIYTGGPPSVAEGSVVSVGGILATRDGERALVNPEITVTAVVARVRPLGIAAPALGGEPFGGQPAAAGGNGLNNVGLLVRFWGTVAGSNGPWILLDSAGTIVRVESGRLSVPPSVGQLVMFTGISGLAADAGDLVPVIRPRGDRDQALL